MRPPPSILEVQVNFIAAWRLFRRDPSGANLFGQDEAAFWKSFWCAVIVAPAFFTFLILIPDELRSDAPDLRVAAVEVISYAMGWAAWPLIVHAAFALLGLQDKFIPYIVAYNWASVPQVGLLLGIAVVAAAIGMPLQLFLLLNLAATIWLLSYHAFIVRVTTGADLPVVIVLVLGEAVLGYMIGFAGDAVAYGLF